MEGHTKFHWNRMIRSWDIVMKPFSKWLSSAILNFQILVFWSRDHYLNVILILHIKFHVNWTINRWDIAKKRFSIRRLSAILNFIFFYNQPVTVLAHQISLKSDDSRPRYSDKTIFNMAAVRHIGFVVTSSYCIWEHYFTFLTLCQIFKYIGLVISDILGLSCFMILAWNCYFRGKIWLFGGK